jgi:AcrR family transcriptional regulator
VIPGRVKRDDPDLRAKPGAPTKPPQIRDAEATKARILEASLVEFARYGLGGARIERIAAAARTNKRMLYYYVGNKEALFLAALEAAYDDIRAAERALNLEALEPAGRDRAPDALHLGYFVKKARIPDAAELGEPAQGPPPQALGKDRGHELARDRDHRLILERGVAMGQIRPGIDPLQLYISVASLAISTSRTRAR